MKFLHQKLRELNGKPYGNYRRIHGKYRLPGFQLSFSHIQGDPYANPSRIRLLGDINETAIPADLYDTPRKEIALADYLLRQLAAVLGEHSETIGSGKGGLFSILQPGQRIAVQNALQVKEGRLDIRIGVGLPGDGRRVMGDEAARLLVQILPDALMEALFWMNLDEEKVRAHIQAYEIQEELREQLAEHDLVAFVADGAVLPRASGISQLPLVDALPFSSPETMRCELKAAGKVFSGMGIGRGITMIAGGGFHGKSTLLQALEEGVFNHIPGDGRELVVCDNMAVKVRAEDGRMVQGSDISHFIKDLPGGKQTASFFTENASGSTSQAANLVEAVALGSRLLLVDEDISAVNFLVNDERMQEIIGRENEPITPLSQRIRDLADKQGLSFILVIGASGDYLDLADRLVVMREYQALDFSDKLKPLSGKEETKNISAAAIISESVLPQDLLWKKWQDTARAAGGKKVKLQARADKSIHIGKLSAEVDRLDGVDNTDYVRGLAHMVWSLVRMEKPAGLPERIQKLQKKIKEEGVDALEDSFSVSYTMPRLLDAARAVLRIRL